MTALEIPFNALLVPGLGMLVALLTAEGRSEQGGDRGGPGTESVSVRVVYDNRTQSSELTKGWGLSFIVKAGVTTVLFDTGDAGSALLGNLRKLSVKPKDVDKVFLSHAHQDHIGGLSAFLKENSNVEVHLLASFPPEIKALVRRYGAQLVEHGPLLAGGAKLEEMRIGPHLYTTGELEGEPPEQALVVESHEGPVMVTGCSHPGIGEMVAAVTRAFGRPLALVVGGFHLFAARRPAIEKEIERIKRLGVVRVAPNHCTGQEAIRLFKQSFGDRFMDARAGALLKIPPTKP